GGTVGGSGRPRVGEGGGGGAGGGGGGGVTWGGFRERTRERRGESPPVQLTGGLAPRRSALVGRSGPRSRARIPTLTLVASLFLRNGHFQDAKRRLIAQGLAQNRQRHV